MILLTGISKTYMGKGVKTPALTGIDLAVKEGEFLAIMGRSGSGKSTLMNIIGCIDAADSGSYRFDGKDVFAMSGKEKTLLRSRSIGFVFQSFNLINEERVWENVAMPLGYAKIGSKERRQAAERMLAKFGMQNKMSNYPAQLSGGEQQRVAIARALIMNPRIILADEPTGNLDEANGQIILDHLRALNHEGVTIVMVTHDQSIAKTCDRMIVMSDGRIL